MKKNFLLFLNSIYYNKEEVEKEDEEEEEKEEKEKNTNTRE